MNKKYFIGKVCTIYVTQTNRSFTDQQFVDYFVGIVESIDSDNVITKHPITGCINFFNKDHIIAICEEQVIYPENEEQATEILEAANPPQETLAASDNPYLDIEGLSKL